ncbi:hypothetical protein H0E87_017204 [Populus deltoides]|uniref:Uncharacterized protein n=1 Tax=Populus deltoides TaxID=3696 RepID=A0A8T2XZF4_POPDE|nr:hypothetical protein H0E87_017204 [Populus deltoides]
MELAAKKRWDGVIMTLLMKGSHGPVFQLINKYKGIGKFIPVILGLYVGKQHMPYNHTDESMEEKLKIVKGRFDINIDINFSEKHAATSNVACTEAESTRHLDVD